MNNKQTRRRDITVADVAKTAQVSKAQAARALGNYGAVSENVRDRVLASAKELSYRPNELARSMNTGKSNTIGVLVGDIENPHFGLALRGITDTAKKSGFNVILINTDENKETEIEGIQVLLQKRVDGLIVVPASSVDMQHLRRIHESGHPLVLLDRKGADFDANTVTADMSGVSYEATKYLIESGHRRIAFISTLKTNGPYFAGMRLGSSQVSERCDGMQRAFQDAGLEQPEDLVHLNAGDVVSIRQITRELFKLPHPATAIVASDGVIALSVVETIQELGLSIPDDVSFLMYDNFAWTRLTSPPITVVAQPVYEMGIAAADALIRQIEGRKTLSPPPTFTAELIRRGSVGPPRTVLSRYSIF